MSKAEDDQDSSDICSTSDEEDFESFKSPGGKESFSAQKKEAPKHEDYGPACKLDLESVGALIKEVLDPKEPCQLINAAEYKHLVLEMTPGIEPFNNSEEHIEQFTMWALKNIKLWCKSDLAKEVLAGFKLLELLSAQLGKPFFTQLCCERWGNRIFDIWEDTREPIHKLTIAQLVADWIHIYDGRVNVMPFRMIAQKMPIPGPTQDARDRRKAWEQKSTKSPAANKTAQSAESPASPKSPKTSKVKIKTTPKEQKEAKIVAGVDAKLVELFERNDFEGNGVIADNDDFQQLCTNVIFKLKLMVPPDAVEQRVAEAGDMAELKWKVEDFSAWFKEAFASEIKNVKL